MYLKKNGLLLGGVIITMERSIVILISNFVHLFGHKIALRTEHWVTVLQKPSPSQIHPKEFVFWEHYYFVFMCVNFLQQVEERLLSTWGNKLYLKISTIILQKNFF